VLLAGGVPARPDEKPDPRAVIDRAMKAMGGEDLLKKFQAIELKDKGTFHGTGKAMPYTGAWAVQGARQLKFTLDMEVEGKKFRMVQVVNGTKGWMKYEDRQTAELKKEQLAEELEQMHAAWVITLVPLRDKAFKLSHAGGAKVAGKDTVGVRVEREGRRDVTLYFDRDTGLLAKAEFPVKEVGGVGNEQKQENYYSEYKTFEGIKHATKVAVFREGKRFVEAEFTEVRPLPGLEESVFSRPE
jgi:hypothetical protein